MQKRELYPRTCPLVALVLWAATGYSAAQLQSASRNLDPAPIPPVIRFTGALKDLSGTPRTTLTDVTFDVFKNMEGGTPIWTETQTVQPDSSGHYTVFLGATRPKGLPIDLFVSGDARWIEVTVPGLPIAGRAALVSVPYALKSGDAQTFAGHPVTDFLFAPGANPCSNPETNLRPRTPLPCTFPLPIQPLTGTADSASQFVSTTPEGPSFISDAQTGPPLQVQSQTLVANLNADLLHGFSDLAFAKLAVSNQFTANQTFGAGIALPDANVEASNPNLFDSAPQDFWTSIFDPSTNTSQKRQFRWQATPVLSSSVAGAQLNLLFGAGGAAATATGLSFNADGTINFAPNQQLPVSAVAAALQQIPNSNTSGGSPSPVANTASYSWSQSPGSNSGNAGSGGSSAAGGPGNGANPIQVGPNTVSLSPCPAGVNGSDLYHYLYISGSGTPEPVLITGGTCKSGTAGGTIQFTAQYAHPLGFSIGSASDGVQEAIIDAANGVHLGGQESRNVLISPGTHVFSARVSVRASGISIQASGASITCNMNDTCLMIGDPTSATAFSRVSVTGLRLRAGVVGGTFPAIEDNAQGTVLTDIGPASGAVAGASFGSLVQIDNDQASLVDRMDSNLAPWSRCDTSFCSAAIYGPGPFNPNAGVLWVKNSNLSLQCKANGIDNWDDNTLHVSDTVVQSYAQFGIRASGIYTNSLDMQLDNVYEEVGNCTNSLGTGEAGLIVMGGFANVSGGTPAAGKLPQYSNTGSTQYNYYVVVHSSTAGISAPYLAGYAMTNGSGPINVVWNKVGRQGTITYDLLRTTGAGAQAPLYGTGNFVVAVSITTANCTDAVCSYTDDAAASPGQYAIASPGYTPSLRLWPGSVILTSIGDSLNGIGTRYFSDVVATGSIVNAGGSSYTSVFAQQCDAGSNWSPILMQCEGGSGTKQVGTIYQLGTQAGLKGRLIFEVPANSSVPNTHVITISDSNPTKTLATPMNRPASDPNDSYIGFDQPGSVAPSQAQLAFGSPVSISEYIGNAGDGTNWFERLTASRKSFRVPVVSPSYQTASNCVSATGACGSAPAGIIAIPVGSSTLTVSTTVVGAKSEIHFDENLSYGPLLGVVCDSAFRHYRVRSQTSGVGFTVETDVAPTTAPACLSFTITN